MAFAENESSLARSIDSFPYSKEFGFEGIFDQKDLPYLEKLECKIGYLSAEDRQLVMQTARFTVWAFRANGIEDRNDGSPASSHLLETASILAEYKMPAKALRYGALHDIAEDIKLYYITFIKDYFGEDIAGGVDRIGVVKSKEKTPEAQKQKDIDRDKELRARLYEAVIEDPLAAITRFAERLHNLRTIKGRLSKGEEGKISAERTARESITVYAPLAWDLGMYEMAWEMYARSLSVLFPKGMEIIEDGEPNNFLFNIKDKRFQAYKIENQKKIKEEIMGVLEAVPPDEITVYPPNLKTFANMMLENRDIKKIEVKSAPMDVDVLESSGQIPFFAYNLIASQKFRIVDNGGDDYFKAVYRNNGRPIYLKTNFTGKDSEMPPMPVNFNFLTHENKTYKLASITDFLAEEKSDDIEKRYAAEQKWEKVVELLKDIREGLGEDTVRDEVYASGIERKLVFPNLHINGIEIGDVPVQSGRSVFDLITRLSSLKRVKALIKKGDIPPDFFLRIKEIKIEDDPRILAMQVAKHIVHNSEIDLATGDEITVRPVWLNHLKNPDPEIESKIAEVLSEAVGNDKGLRFEALKRGDSIIRKKFRDIASDRKNISVINGFDEVLMEKYGENTDQFFIDLGIGLITNEKGEEVVQKMVDWFESLPQIQIYVPRGENRHGFEAICASVIAKEKISLVTFSGGESDTSYEGEKMGGEVIYTLESSEWGPHLSQEYLEKLGKKINKEIRKRFKPKTEPKILIYENNKARLRQNPEA